MSKKQNAKIAQAIKGQKEAKQATRPLDQVNEKIAEAGLPIQFLRNDVACKIGSRNELMKEAQKRGIKYFRILSKEELGQVLADSISPQEITVITIAAKERWQAGWGSKKKAEVTNG